jgi:predicted DCC family thiol-disulfide oxidoreductase YuxK
MPEADPKNAGPDGLWVFDGVCNFCSGSVNAILRLDRRGAIQFTPMQSAYGQALMRTAGLDPEAPSSFLFFDRGRPLEKSAAVLALLDRLPSPWRWGRMAGLLPCAWRDWAYDTLAANRYRLMGRKDQCMIPSPEQRARFVFEAPGQEGAVRAA